MPKRAVVVFFIFCLLMGVVCLQLISVSIGLDTAAGTVKIPAASSCRIWARRYMTATVGS